jgi:peptide deformylase
MDSGDNSVTDETDTTVIVMQSTIDHLVGTKQINKLNEMMEGDWDKKLTESEIVYYQKK